MRAMLVGCAILVGCGGGGGAAGMPPPAVDGAVGGSDGTSSNATRITFTLNSAPNTAEAFTFAAAYQDGNGAWQPAPMRSGDAYAFDVSSPTWGFAYTCEVNVRVNNVLTDLRDVVEYHFATAERTSLTDDVLERCTDRIPRVELSGTLSQTPANQTTYRVAYKGTAVFIDRTTAKYDMLVPSGTHDLLVLHGSENGNPGDFLIDSAVVQRNVAVNAALVHDVNVNNSANARNLSVSIAVSGKTPLSSETTTSLFTATGTAVPVAHISKGTLSSRTLAAAQLVAGDIYDQRVTAEFVKGQAVTMTTATAATATAPGNVSITTAPTPLGVATVTSAATTPYPIYTTTWPAYAGAIGYTWTLVQPPPPVTPPTTPPPPMAGCGGTIACTITWTAFLSPGAAGAMPSYTMPDLSKLPGWSTALQFVPAAVAGAKANPTGDVTAMTSTAGAMDFPPGPPAAGTKRVFAHSLTTTP